MPPSPGRARPSSRPLCDAPNARTRVAALGLPSPLTGHCAQVSATALSRRRGAGEMVGRDGLSRCLLVASARAPPPGQHRMEGAIPTWFPPTPGARGHPHRMRQDSTHRALHRVTRPSRSRVQRRISSDNSLSPPRPSLGPPAPNRASPIMAVLPSPVLSPVPRVPAFTFSQACSSFVPRFCFFCASWLSYALACPRAVRTDRGARPRVRQQRPKLRARRACVRPRRGCTSTRRSCPTSGQASPRLAGLHSTARESLSASFCPPGRPSRA